MTDLQFSTLLEVIHASVAVVLFGVGYIGGYLQ